jgi:transposase InsO family protein
MLKKKPTKLIKVLRSDNGGEYKSKWFYQFLSNQ